MTIDSAATAVLDPIPDAISAPMTGRWRLDLDRCAIEANVAMLGVTLWRARLQPLEGELTVPELDELGQVADGSYVRISAMIASRASYASLPFTRDWFLPDAALSAPISLAGNAFAPKAESRDTVYTLARTTCGQDLWWTRLAIRFTRVGTERAVVAITGSVPRCRNAPFPKTPVTIDAAAEFVRCA